ncbi:hypothetical protein [Treponema sp. OMZ 840]|uniref:hypothetical protein n=1 Tax=Treponema sp. OMZ 840 TaxID=244313 RepID=UPI003D8BBC17
MKNNSYIHNLKIDDVPWNRLPTTYARATLFPQYFEVLDNMQESDKIEKALDEALLQAQSNDINMRTKGIRFLRQASCLETGTKNTYPIRDWFSEAVNYTKLFEIIQSEKDPKLLWEYLFLIKIYCERYIDSAHSVKNSETFISKKENMEFKIKACKLGELFLVHQDASVRQAATSLLWYLKKTSEV